MGISASIALVCLLFTQQVAPGQISVLETEKLRLEQGKRLAAGKEMRTWHFTKFPEPMEDWPNEVKGAFLEVRCEDSQFSEAALILVREDFRLRSYPAKALTASDRALADKLEAQRAAALGPLAGKAYAPNREIYDPAKDDAKVTFAESPHFTFYLGKDTKASGAAAGLAPAFLPTQKAWFEKVWDFYARVGAPMPMADEKSPKKIDVYISGTGLPKHPEGFAFGGESVLMHPAALGPGSSVVPHEFTHTIQLYSKGFRDSDLVGWFWECHANWNTHQFMPSYPPVLAHYSGRAHYELNSSRHNYGSWPFLQTMAENPKLGPAFPYDIWPACKRSDSGAALEDPFQTIMRLGGERGYWKDPIAGFGDVIGELAARMVGWDFQNQFYQEKETRQFFRTYPGIPSHRVVLQPVADRADWWQPIHSHAPRQYGVNLIDVDATEKEVAVDFSGIVDESEGSDWRVTWVAKDATGNCRYSSTVHGGVLAFTPREGESLTLAIAATPTIYKPQRFRPGFNQKPRFPYEVRFKGAKPREGPPVTLPAKPDGGRHANGGGFVASSAKVASSAFVGSDARVIGEAQVSGNARIEGHAIISQNARVLDQAVVSGYCRVTESAVVSGNARMDGFARIGERATLTGNANVMDYPTIDGNGIISGNALVKGFGEIHTTAATEISGTTICGEDLEIHLVDYQSPKIMSGMLYGFMNTEFFKKELTDNLGLYAHWDFEKAHGKIVKDVNADCDGVLRGSARIGSVDGRQCLVLDGKGQVLVEGSPAAGREITFDLTFQWQGGDGQRVFEFGDAQRSLALVINDGGRPVFAVRDGKEVSSVRSSERLTPGKFSRLVISARGKEVTLYLDGKQAGVNNQLALSPADIAAKSGRLGGGVEGKGLSGAIDDFKTYRIATPGPVPSGN